MMQLAPEIYLVVFGPHTSCDDPLELLANLCDGHPRVEAVLVGSQLIGIVQFPGTPAGAYQRVTTQRILFTNYRTQFSYEVCDSAAAAMLRFGSLVRDAAPGVIAHWEEGAPRKGAPATSAAE